MNNHGTAALSEVRYRNWRIIRRMMDLDKRKMESSKKVLDLTERHY